MISIQKYTVNDPLLAEAGFAVRRAVFVEEQNVLPDEEFEGEEESIHFLLFFNQVPAATARWRRTPKGIKLERFAVLREFRNKGLGSMILQAVLLDLKDRPETIYLHAQLSALKVYERAGFVREGDIFSECDILHYKMVYQPEVKLNFNEVFNSVRDYLFPAGKVIHTQSGVVSDCAEYILKGIEQAVLSGRENEIPSYLVNLIREKTNELRPREQES